MRASDRLLTSVKPGRTELQRAGSRLNGVGHAVLVSVENELDMGGVAGDAECRDQGRGTVLGGRNEDVAGRTPLVDGVRGELEALEEDDARVEKDGGKVDQPEWPGKGHVKLQGGDVGFEGKFRGFDAEFGRHGLD